MPRFRDSVKDVFAKAGVDITPLSCILVPVSHFATVKRTTVKTRSGDSYEAAVLILPMDRLGRAVQEAPFGEESFCEAPEIRTTVIHESNPRTLRDDVERRMVLTWEQLRRLKRTLDGNKRPRKGRFQKAIGEISAGLSLTDGQIDQARRQYYAYAGGPLDEVELLGLYDAGLPAGSECAMDDIVTFLPDELSANPAHVRQACNQWKSVTSARETP